MEKREVVVIGAGPAGLSVAMQLRARGVDDVVVVEREAQAGGVPRHCGHWGFGWESHRRLRTGPAFAATLRQNAAGIDVRTATTVLEFRSPHVMRVQNVKGIADMEARHIVIATGTREATRAQRLIGGNRVTGVMNTGTLQQMVYLQGLKPFSRPVIIGGEWVSFSSLMTCRHAGIAPVAMLADERLEAPSFFKWGARLHFGVPVRMGCELVAIHGKQQVEAVTYRHSGIEKTLACDGVILTGKFRPENALFTSGPLAKQHQHVWHAGNVVGEIKTAGRCVVEGRTIADRIAEKLR